MGRTAGRRPGKKRPSIRMDGSASCLSSGAASLQPSRRTSFPSNSSFWSAVNVGRYASFCPPNPEMTVRAVHGLGSTSTDR